MSATSFYICRPGGETEGPYTQDQLRSMWAMGHIGPGTQIHIEHKGKTMWTAIEPWVIARKESGGMIKGLVALLGVVLFLLIVIGGVAGGGTSSPPPDRTDSGFYAGQGFVRRGLKSPATAKFSSASDPESYARKRADGLIACGGWVDAANSFGAVLRSRWHAIVRDNGDSWDLVWMKLDGETIGTHPGPSATQ